MKKAWKSFWSSECFILERMWNLPWCFIYEEIWTWVTLSVILWNWNTPLRVLSLKKSERILGVFGVLFLKEFEWISRTLGVLFWKEFETLPKTLFKKNLLDPLCFILDLIWNTLRDPNVLFFKESEKTLETSSVLF